MENKENSSDSVISLSLNIKEEQLNKQEVGYYYNTF